MSEVQDSKTLIRSVLNSEEVPFAFRYDGVTSRDFLKAWERTVTRTVGADNVVAHTVVYRDPATGLECIVELSTYPDSPPWSGS